MRRLLPAWIGLSLCAALSAGEGGAPVAPCAVRLRPEAAVSTERLRLDQVAAPESALPGGRALSGVWLGRSPAEGETRLVRAADVAAALRKAGLAVPVEGDCRVERAPEAAGEERTVWTASKDLRKGRILAEADLAERRALPEERVDEELPCEALAGRELSRDLARGAVLRGADVRPPVSVRKGDLVKVSTEGEGASVSFWARSLADARAGEAVEMELAARPGSRVKAVVRGPTEARLEGEPR